MGWASLHAHRQVPKAFLPGHRKLLNKTVQFRCKITAHRTNPAQRHIPVQHRVIHGDEGFLRGKNRVIQPKKSRNRPVQANRKKI